MWNIKNKHDQSDRIFTKIWHETYLKRFGNAEKKGKQLMSLKNTFWRNYLKRFRTADIFGETMSLKHAF